MIKLYCLSAIILTMSVTVAGCSNKHDTAAEKAPPVIVKGAVTETAALSGVPETFEVSGTVRARTSAIVSARIAGTVALLRVREGDRVAKGQLLAQLEAQENSATAAAATAGIDEARRGLDEAMTRKKLADTTFERYQKLFNEQAVTRQEFDNRQSERDLALQGVARAEARLKQAQESSRGATAISDYTRIVAPISGIITSRQADLGATVFPAQPLMTIEDEGSYQLDLAIPESMAAKVKPGTTLQVTLDAVNAAFDAKIAEVVPSADPSSRTFTVKINLSQKGLKSGMFGRGTITLGSMVNSIMVPKKAVFERGALTTVWVLDKEGIARMRIIKAGKIIGEKVEILAGLSVGERIVTGGADKVSEGSKVE
jgi:multidrug efflux system membrane fusion protein